MKKYETPKLDIIKLTADIITTSSGGLGVEDNADGTGTGNATGNGGHYFG